MGAPALDLYREIFERECKRQGLTLDDDSFDFIVHQVVEEKELELAAYHPRFIVDQVVATCKFMRQQPHFEPRFIEYAIDNLRVKRSADAKPKMQTAAHVS